MVAKLVQIISLKVMDQTCFAHLFVAKNVHLLAGGVWWEPWGPGPLGRTLNPALARLWQVRNFSEVKS